ncbi:MAG TPA: phosphotransferase [Anaerolineae bacterium]|nr:phosphotransferase [Anaerolineae bacterium]
MPDRYQYVRIHTPYFCLQQNPLSLAWLLTFKTQPLRLGALRLGGKVALSVAKALIRHRLAPRNGGSLLELPFYGELCLPVHRGYKVFNLRAKTVVRMFAPATDALVVAREINAVRDAGRLEFAPAVRRWSVDERWYEESLVIGYRADLSAGELTPETYQRDIASCLERMILLQAPQRMKLGEYVNQARGAFAADGLFAQIAKADSARVVKRFLESTADRLLREGEQEIDLVFSHGDFSLRNILQTNDGVCVIDWENGGSRSPVCDLYNFFFTEMYYGRLALDKARAGIVAAIASMQSRLQSRASQLAPDLLSLAPLYRALYYFERVLVLLARELTDERLRVILRSIELFKRYEEEVYATRQSV